MTNVNSPSEVLSRLNQYEESLVRLLDTAANVMESLAQSTVEPSNQSKNAIKVGCKKYIQELQSIYLKISDELVHLRDHRPYIATAYGQTMKWEVAKKSTTYIAIHLEETKNMIRNQKNESNQSHM